LQASGLTAFSRGLKSDKTAVFINFYIKNRSVLHPSAVMQRRVKMKFFRYCLMGMFVLLCLFGSCSLGEKDPGDFSASEEASQEEEENKEEGALSEERNYEEENHDEAQDDPDEILPVPKFLSCTAVSETEIVFEFSQPVKIKGLQFNPELKIEKIEEGSTVRVKLAENPEPGLLVKIDLLAEDEYRNIVNELVTFRTRNNYVPALQINELRTEYKKPQVEYIEFKMLSDGNLGALRVFAASNDKAPMIYEFGPVTVKKDDYVVLHLRTPEESCKDEFGESLIESGGTDSCSTARDFWIRGSTEFLRKTDAVYVLDQNDNVLDAVMFAVDTNSWLKKTYFSETAKFLFDQGAWKSAAGTVCSVADVVNSSNTTMTRSICRDETVENTHTAADWYITANSGSTSGSKNNPKRFS
jgi:hypothetical protein